jgi:hypothetical protein
MRSTTPRVKACKRREERGSLTVIRITIERILVNNPTPTLRRISLLEKY